MTNFRAEKYFKTIKEYLNFQKIEDLKTFLKELSIPQCASISYFPLIGWILPLVLNKNNPACQRHIKQGFVISMLFLLIIVFLNFVNIFTPVEWRYFRVGLVIFIYSVNLFYLLFCIVAMRMVLKNRVLNLHFLKKFMDLIHI